MITFKKHSYRKMTNYEKSILLRLLEISFPGRDEILENVNNLLVKTFDDVDNCGSLLFKIEDTKSLRHIPVVEASFMDKDGIPIEYILFVTKTGNKPYELEILKYGEKKITTKPKPSSLKVLKVESPGTNL